MPTVKQGFFAVAALFAWGVGCLSAADPGKNPAPRTLDEKWMAELEPGKTLTGAKQLGDNQVWVDTKRKILISDGTVCLTEGYLELFACPKGSKEHESIVSLLTDAMTIHAGLLAIGAEAGSPVKYQPEYSPAHGTVIDIFVVWLDDAGKRQHCRAQHWVRNFKTKKELDIDWVFAGSAINVDPDTGEKYYLANVGDLICVSNFSTAALDLPIRSSQENNELMFEAFREHLPAKGTKVRVVFLPRIAPKETAPARTTPAVKSKGQTGSPKSGSAP